MIEYCIALRLYASVILLPSFSKPDHVHKEKEHKHASPACLESLSLHPLHHFSFSVVTLLALHSREQLPCNSPTVKLKRKLRMSTMYLYLSLQTLMSHVSSKSEPQLDVSRSQKVVACCLLPKAEQTQRSNKSTNHYITILSSYKFTGIN